MLNYIKQTIFNTNMLSFDPETVQRGARQIREGLYNHDFFDDEVLCNYPIIAQVINVGTAVFGLLEVGFGIVNGYNSIVHQDLRKRAATILQLQSGGKNLVRAFYVFSGYVFVRALFGDEKIVGIFFGLYMPPILLEIFVDSDKKRPVWPAIALPPVIPA